MNGAFGTDAIWFHPEFVSMTGLSGGDLDGDTAGWSQTADHVAILALPLLLPSTSTDRFKKEADSKVAQIAKRLVSAMKARCKER